MGKSEEKPKPKIRCAIYTRKSTTEGLDQEFTSLDNQRESCESYIASQRNEGWLLLSDKYDDGGFTGANLERPALQQLVRDIKDGKIDCVVVYKVDRLSRSLIDFTQLLELFEKQNVTFVSVTQAFNTNSSMGRLTLNILLSFAQFEREIISERTRDKMGAARRKGKWIGGTIPLGYDLDRETHKLTVNEKEARIVREIFEIYLKEKSTRRVLEIVNQKQYKTKHFISRTGREVGGKSFNLTSVQLLIKTVLYTGKVKYRGEVFKGMHDPIIGDELFARAQEINDQNRVICVNPRTQKKRGLLTGLIRCKVCGKTMIYTYTQKNKNKRYSYYLCNSAQKHGYHTCPTKSLNADEVEAAVIDCISKVAEDPGKLAANLEELQGKLRAAVSSLDKELASIISQIQTQKVKLKEITELPDGAGKEREWKAQQERLEEFERKESELRVSKTQAEDKMITQNELKSALVVNSPVWETLFSEEKRRILNLLLESVDYDGAEKVLGINFNNRGIKLLNQEIQAPPQEASL